MDEDAIAATVDGWILRYLVRRDNRHDAPTNLRDDVRALEAPRGRIKVEATTTFLKELFSALFSRRHRIFVGHDMQRPGWFEVHISCEGRMLGGMAVRGSDVLEMTTSTLESWHEWGVGLEQH